MRRLFNLGYFTAVLGLVFAFGAIDAAAQKRKPVLRKKPVVKRAAVVRAPALYRIDTGTNIRVRMNGTLSSRTARVGNRFTTTVTEPVYSTNGVVVIPVGSTVTGRVDTVTPSRKGGKPGEIGVSFVSVKLPNGTTRAINGSLTDLDTKSAKSDNEGTASGDKMKNRKIIFIGGGAGGGAVLGGAFGGGKGALIGGIIGGIAGAIAENQTKGEEAEVRSGTEFGVYLNQSISMAKWNEPIN
ncbi:MAG TPA: hypothetical protein VF599_09875 [Pyrinomonadaceae bacterium]|jgi:hypothetical protein